MKKIWNLQIKLEKFKNKVSDKTVVMHTSGSLKDNYDEIGREQPMQ